jgi:tetratricopeptide (TPR) repeat protein
MTSSDQPDPPPSARGRGEPRGEIDVGRLVAVMNRGRGHQQAGALDLALAAFDEAIGLAPLYATAYLDRGATRQLQGKAVRAIADLTRAIALATPGAERGAAYFNRGLAHETSRALPRALRDLRAAVGEGRAEAQDELDRLAAAHPAVSAETTAVQDRARAALLCKEAIAAFTTTPVDALVMFWEASELDPRSQEAPHGLGIVNAALGRGEAAIAAFDRALAIEPQHPGMRAEGLYNRGMLHAGVRDRGAAIADLEACLALCADPATGFPRFGDAAKEQAFIGAIEQRLRQLRAQT